MEYPDFTRQILQLKLLEEKTTDAQKLRLVGKWIASLEDINEQISHLKKIEQFAQIVKKD